MKLKKGIILQKMGSSFVAYDNKTSTLHELNETGFFILKKLEKKRTRKQIVELIVKRFKVSKNQAEKDLLEFTDFLVKKDLIVDK
jgi:hypothetical protein